MLQAAKGLASLSLSRCEQKECSDALHSVLGEVAGGDLAECIYPGGMGDCIQNDKDGAQHSWAPYSWAIWSYFKDCFEDRWSACEDVLQDFSCMSKEQACWYWAMLCLVINAYKETAEGMLDPRIAKLLSVVTGAAIVLLRAAGLALFGCLCLAGLVVTQAGVIDLVYVLLCLDSVAVCTRSGVSHAVGYALGAGDWVLWTVWDWLMSACGWQRALPFKHPRAPEAKVQWGGRREGWKWAVKYQRAARASAAAEERALSSKWAARRITQTVVRQARLGMGIFGDGAVGTENVRGIVVQPGRPARVRWVVGGKLVTRAEAMQHKGKGGAVMCVPELHGGGSHIFSERPRSSNVRVHAAPPEAGAAGEILAEERRAESGAVISASELPGGVRDTADEGAVVYCGVGGHATPSQDDAVFTRTPEQAKEHQAGVARLGMNLREVSQ